MKKVLIGLLLIIPMAIVAAVVLVTNVVLITPDITVASIAIVDPDFYQDVDSVSLYFDRPGMQYQLAALVLPKKATNKKVHWSIENSVSYDPEYEGDIATVDDNGNVTINWTGTFDVFAKTDDGGKTDRCRFEIKSDVAKKAYIVYNGVKLIDEMPNIDITTDEIIRLEACAHPIDVDLEYVTWESNDKHVLSVDANGVVVPQGAGTATVTMKLKSKDFVSGSEKRVAPEIVRTVQIKVRGGVFPTALKYVHTDSVSLSSIGAEGSTLVKSQNATLKSGAIVFSGTGYAVLEKGGKTMTLRKVESETSIVFENADVIENSTVIVGKVPYKLNAIFAASGEKASGARYYSSNTDVATIDEKTGLITAISSGEVTFTAEFGEEESISIDLHVRKPVIYFMLEKDAPQGIADECVYGNMYFEYSGEEMTGRLVPFRQIKVVAPEDLTGSENLNRFKWSVVSDGGIATIDENGMITFTLSEDEKGVRKNVKVVAEAKDSPYAGDSIKREYNFTVMYGVNVETADELMKAVNKEIDGKKYEVFMRNDITIRSIRYTESDTSGISGDKGTEKHTWGDAPLRLKTSLYGNGHTIDWKHRDYDDPTAKANIMGSNILVMDGPQGKDAPRVLLRNVKIKSSELPKDNTFASKDFVGIGVETKGNVHVQYCIIENAMYCMRVGSYDNEKEAVKKGDFAETLIEGTIMSNSSKFTCFSWCTYKNQRVVMKNCVYGQAASPSVGFSSGDNEEEHTCNLDIQGILRIYNWKQGDDLDLVGGITNNPGVDDILKKIIQKGLQGKRFEHLFVKDSGVRYMHCGMLFSGFAHKNRVTVTGALEENGFDHEEIKLEELFEGAAILARYMNPVTFYGYTDESKTPVKHNSNLVHSQGLYKLLRGE